MRSNPKKGRDRDAASAADVWAALDLPVPAPAPPGFARRVTARAYDERRATFGLSLAPGMARLAAAFAVVVGIAGGAGLGLLAVPAEEVTDELAWSSESFAAEVVDGLTSLAVSSSDSETTR